MKWNMATRLLKSPQNASWLLVITLLGVKAKLSYREEESYWEVLTYGKKDRGIAVITQIDKESTQADRRILKRFWNTLSLKL
jgi:hypothetical protein